MVANRLFIILISLWVCLLNPIIGISLLVLLSFWVDEYLLFVLGCICLLSLIKSTLVFESDSLEYYRLYQEARSMSLSSYLAYRGYDFGFWIAMFSCAKLGLNFRIFIFVSVFVSYLFLWLGYKQWAENWLVNTNTILIKVAFILFSSYFLFSISTQVIRQFIAGSLLILAYGELLKSYFIRAFTIVLIALTIHASVGVLLAAYIFSLRFKFSKRKLISLALLVAIVLFVYFFGVIPQKVEARIGTIVNQLFSTYNFTIIILILLVLRSVLIKTVGSTLLRFLIVSLLLALAGINQFGFIGYRLLFYLYFFIPGLVVWIASKLVRFNFKVVLNMISLLWLFLFINNIFTGVWKYDLSIF